MDKLENGIGSETDQNEGIIAAKTRMQLMAHRPEH